MSSGVKKRIVVFCPPFSGHLNVLLDAIAATELSIDWTLVITGWTNIHPVLKATAADVRLLDVSELTETDPALWTFPRVVELLEPSLHIIDEVMPDLIMYDFFSLEGSFAGKLRGIPTLCSIPAFIGPFETQGYLQEKLSSPPNQSSIALLKQKWNIDVQLDRLEMVSDGILLPSKVNIVWSYKSVVPLDFMEGRADNRYVFVGSSKQLVVKDISEKNVDTPQIYLSFGTVVMDNLWNQQPDLRDSLRALFGELAARWKLKPWKIVVATQGKNILDTYPGNWEIHNTVDQPKILTESTVFVTHGGSNSFHESLVAKVPMVVVPFFGDQHLVAQQVATLGFGYNAAPNGNIDTHNAKEFLTPNLAEKIDVAVSKIVSDSSIAACVHDVDLEAQSLISLLQGKIEFSEGDLLFGTNVARQQYITDTKLEEEYRILEFSAFSELAPSRTSLPRIVDMYHDVVLDDVLFDKDIASGMEPYTSHLREYQAYLADETDFEKMCIKGIDFFSKIYHIHFILESFDSTVNRITTAEIKYILANSNRLEQSVTFYRKINRCWVAVEFDEVKDLVAK